MGSEMCIRDRVGVAENSWISVRAWDGEAAVHSAGVLYVDGALQPQERDEFSLVTSVVEITNDVALVSTFARVDTNGDGSWEFSSNRTCHLFSTPSAADDAIAEIKFLEPSPAVRNRGGIADFHTATDFVSASQYALSSEASTGYRTDREGVYLELALSEDLGKSTNIRYDRNDQRFIEARLESVETGDHIIVLMLETESPGVFRSVAPVMLSDNKRASGNYCPAQPAPDTVLSPAYTQNNDACVLASSSSDQLKACLLYTSPSPRDS